ncbi:MAG: glycosyltransferase 87 family protein [Candidatus Limnocylindrales bacterium]|jgi:hypothetical protein
MASRIGRLIRRALAEPPRPPLPGASLEPGLRRRWVGFFLPGAFVFLWLLTFAVGFNWQTVGVDARIYYHGSAAWLAGENPWATGALLNGRVFTYAGLPPTAILLAPLTFLPEEAFVWLWLALSLAAAIAVVRALRLPVVWVAYPPLLYGVIAANPHVVLLALLVAGGTWGGGLASVIKIVAIPPLVGERRWRALLLGAAAIGASMLLLPGLWTSFLNQAGTVQSTINAESGGGLSAWGNPGVFLATAVSLAVLALLDMRASAWLVVPALFPTTQYYYAMFALPIDPFLAGAMAFPVPLMAPLATIGYTAIRVGLVAWRRSGRARRPGREILGRSDEGPQPESSDRG